MTTLGLDKKQRLRNRILFYVIVLAALWATDYILPQPGELEEEKWASMGVARPYFAVPVEEVVAILIKESR